jgi:hypothetical protein
MRAASATGVGHAGIGLGLELCLNAYQGWYNAGVWEVRYLPEASRERAGLPATERLALDHAVDKLAAYGPQLPFPHQSSVRQAKGLRELRPRSGRSPWRALYLRRADVFVVAAVGPEAKTDPRGFARAVSNALARLQEDEPS